MQFRVLARGLAACVLYLLCSLSISSAQDGGNDLLKSAIELTCTVGRISQVPDPRDAPYEDCITYIELLADPPALSRLPQSDILAAFWAFRNRMKLPASSYKTGERLHVSLVPFADIENRVSTTMQVDDVGDFALPVYWAISANRISGGRNTLSDRPSENANNTTPPDAVISTPATPGSNDPQPLPIPSEYKALAPEVKQILELLRAKGSEKKIHNKDLGLSFEAFQYLYTPRFWEPSTETSNSVRPLDAIARYAGQCAEQGIELIMFFPPRKTTIYPDLATGLHFDPRQNARVDVFFLEFLKQLDGIGVAYVDLTPVFLRERDQGFSPEDQIKLYEYTGAHWRSEGAHLAAAAIAERIRETKAWRENPELRTYHPSGGAGPTATQDPATPPPESDIKQIDALFEITDWAHLGDTELFDRNAQDTFVQLVGDSFLAYPSNTTSSFWYHLVKELNLPTNVISIAAGSPTMSRRVLARRGVSPRTKILVWEIVPDLLMDFRQWHMIPLVDSSRYSLLDFPEYIEPRAVRNDITTVKFYRYEQEALEIAFDVKSGSVDASVTFSKLPANIERSFYSTIILLPGPGEENYKVNVGLSAQGRELGSARIAYSSQWEYSIRKNWTVDIDGFGGEEVDITLSFKSEGTSKGASILIVEPEIYGKRPWPAAAANNNDQ